MKTRPFSRQDLLDSMLKTLSYKRLQLKLMYLLSLCAVFTLCVIISFEIAPVRTSAPLALFVLSTIVFEISISRISAKHERVNDLYLDYIIRRTRARYPVV